MINIPWPYNCDLDIADANIIPFVHCSLFITNFISFRECCSILLLPFFPFLTLAGALKLSFVKVTTHCGAISLSLRCVKSTPIIARCARVLHICNYCDVSDCSAVVLDLLVQTDWAKLSKMNEDSTHTAA